MHSGRTANDKNHTISESAAVSTILWDNAFIQDVSFSLCTKHTHTHTHTHTHSRTLLSDDVTAWYHGRTQKYTRVHCIVQFTTSCEPYYYFLHTPQRVGGGCMGAGWVRGGNGVGKGVGVVLHTWILLPILRDSVDSSSAGMDKVSAPFRFGAHQPPASVHSLCVHTRRQKLTSSCTRKIRQAMHVLEYCVYSWFKW